MSLSSTWCDLASESALFLVPQARCVSMVYAFNPVKNVSVSWTIGLIWLQSDKTSKLGVLGLVDHAHTAVAQFLDHAIMGNSLANQ